ncbi:MBL fold metallo-hydrolase [bacterium]|nr:MBL fold metallo-hydrolase [bacterium]
MHDFLTLTLMGTGSSGGVPRVGNVWGNCDPDEPRNRRRRCSLLIEREAEKLEDELQENLTNRTTVVIDTGADLREQLLTSDVKSIEGVVLTHSHADHIFGLDDLRQMAVNLRRPIDVWIDDATRTQVMAAFGYCFLQAPGSSYPAFCTEHTLTPCTPLIIDGPGGAIQINTLVAEHGDINALGIRVGNAVYLPDMKRITHPKSIELLSGIDTLIVDALRYNQHPSHMNVDESLEFIECVKPERAILTNMHGDLDYHKLKSSLPDGVEPGYDGLKIKLQTSNLTT